MMDKSNGIAEIILEMETKMNNLRVEKSRQEQAFDIRMDEIRIHLKRLKRLQQGFSCYNPLREDPVVEQEDPNVES